MVTNQIHASFVTSILGVIWATSVLGTFP